MGRSGATAGHWHCKLVIRSHDLLPNVAHLDPESRETPPKIYLTPPPLVEVTFLSNAGAKPCFRIALAQSTRGAAWGR